MTIDAFELPDPYWMAQRINEAMREFSLMDTGNIRDAERRGWYDTPPPELTAREVFIGYDDSGQEVWTPVE